MKRSLFTILFMVTVTIVFISLLAVVNEYSQNRIQKNFIMQKNQSILYAFDMLPDGVDEDQLAPNLTTPDLPWDEAAISMKMSKEIQTIWLPVSVHEKELLEGSFLVIADSVEIYVRVGEDDQILAYGFPMRGKGLWGTMTAFGAISADFTRMVGIDFTEQVETPGLGARITEQAFKIHFRNLNLEGFSEESGQDPIVMVSQKNENNLEKSTRSVEAITGATQTCNGVLNMLNTDLRFYLTVLKKREQ
jgi:Na(+)-translocating NADH:ubiquinone oxidoreductase C subunit